MGMLSRIRDGLSFNQQGDNHTIANFGCTMGVVVDTDDPLQMGRLRIYCPEWNDDPKKVQHLPWASYVSPYGGSIRNPAHTKGHHKDNNSTEGTTQYGFWAIPELGANVLVTCINGDIRKRVWLGCMYEHREVGGLFHGIYDWEESGGAPDGPYCAPRPKLSEKENYNEDERKPMQPLYDNLSKAFQNDRNSSEWKTRGADYSGAVNVKIDSFGTSDKLAANEDDSWVKEKLGAMGYDWTSFKNLGAILASKVIGLMSPGLHSISLDDRPFNSRIKIRTTAGHQIILDDTNERMYISTYEGNSWVELDVNGNIDVYSDRRISMRAKKDINFSTDESFRVKATKGIFMYAGNKTGQANLETTPADGQIRFHSQNDTHFFTEGNFYQTINGNMDFTMDGTSAEGDYTGLIKGKYNLELQTDTYNLILPSNKLLINGETIEIVTGSLIVDASSKIQLKGANSAAQISGSKITLMASTVGFNDYGTTVTTLADAINLNSASHGRPPIIPVPQLVITSPIVPPTFAVEKTEISPWTNRVPDHEPWPRVMKQDGADSLNKNNEGYKDNVDWIDQFNNVGEDGRKDIGVIEGDHETKRGDFWRR